MRRTRLTWFALGALTILSVSILAKMLLVSDEPRPTIAVLELIEPVESREGFRNEDMIANVTGELARNCGATFFKTTFLFDDHIPTMEIAIIPINSVAIECILKESKRRSIQTSIIFRRASESQTR